MKKKVQLQIGEPWNFTIEGCGNILQGSVEGICLGSDEKNWQGKYVLISLSPGFEWKGHRVTHFLVSPRYKGDSVEDVIMGKKVIVGIAIIKPGVSLKLDGRFAPDQVEYFGIGSIQEITASSPKAPPLSKKLK